MLFKGHVSLTPENTLVSSDYFRRDSTLTGNTPFLIFFFSFFFLFVWFGGLFVYLLIFIYQKHPDSNKLISRTLRAVHT